MVVVEADSGDCGSRRDWLLWYLTLYCNGCYNDGCMVDKR